jgi:RNA-directed DNA polymerase
VLPPLISFETPQQLKEALGTYFSPTSEGVLNFDALVSNDLPPLVSAAAFGTILGINPKLLTAMTKFPQKYYREFSIKRKSGGSRLIRAPRTFLKAVQQYIHRYILSQLDVPPHINGFVKGRGVITNASIHRGAPYVLNVDVEDFFGSITEKAVREFFLELGYNADMARLLMRLCTYWGSLPQGAPTSPSLANHIFSTVDAKILEICTPKNLRYSRYADDLTFSGTERISQEFLYELQALLETHGFKVNSKKTRFSRPGQAKYVTGLVVNERVQAPRELRRNLRAMFHNAERDPSAFSDKSSHLLGWASYVNSYDRKLGAQYLKIGKRIAQGIDG